MKKEKEGMVLESSAAEFEMICVKNLKQNILH